MAKYGEGYWEETTVDFEDDDDDMTKEEWEEYMDYLYSLIEENRHDR